MRTPPPDLAEAWWPLDSVAPTNSAWHRDHAETGWWDPGDMHRTRLRHATALVDELVASLPSGAVSADATLLEIGCGPGSSLGELATRWPGRLHGWDGDGLARDAARWMAPEAVVHDAPSPPLPLEDGAVDVVWAPRCFARGAGDWAGLLAEAHRVLRPGGLLVAVLAGPGVWAWEATSQDWEEELTGSLLTGLARGDEHGGPLRFVSRWWLQEHWGRGFGLVAIRRAGVAMPHPDRGFGIAVWRRRDGAAIATAALGAVRAGVVREGLAWRRQLALADAEARASAARHDAAVSQIEQRNAALADLGAVAEHPRVRDAAASLQALEAELSAG
jgi:SAM-dependent methyltransferase